MPIHDQSYRRYAGERLPAGLAWRVIARAAIVARVKTRLCLGLLLIAWLPFLARAVQIYVASTLPEAAALVAVSPRLFHDFLAQQAPFVFFLTVYVGSGLVADDRRSHALQIYLARPLTRAEYLAGKLVVPAVFLAAVTVVPALLLAIVQLAFDGPSFLGEHLYVVPAILLVSGIEVIVASFTVVACSSLSTSRRF
ncbi:MAG: hypothetical protein FJW23_09870, partial [Acidimicrobiia bacterium]|nr:hypothetical protein [Acidimicrobiia bacterium]